MSIIPNKLLLAFYGDDFTGSTDALEFLSRAGAKTVLFIGPPTSEQLERYQGLQAIGVAGRTRSMVPADMEKELQPAFKALKKLGAKHVHYKVCSTFDSSPVIGSIGRAIDIGANIFSSQFIPLMVAAPMLGRYCIFGNLFARMGIGSKEAIYRLDRHPSMSHHPITPADESDLRLHLSKQTSKRIALMDILQVELPIAEAGKKLQEIIGDGAEVILFDALHDAQMEGIGQLIDNYSSGDDPLFSVGSSGVEMALGSYWKKQGILQATQTWKNAGKAEPLLVVSGSCSPVTSKQIAWALSQGFAEVTLDTAAIADNRNSISVIENHIAAVVSLIRQGKSVIVHSSLGNDDKRVEKAKDIFTKKGYDEIMINQQTSKLFGSALGRIVRDVVSQTPLKRVVIAGGDTSSYAAREMGIEAVEMIAPLSPGAPLCKAYAPGSPVDGMEVNFKGGQVGTEDYFGIVLNGKYS